MKFRIYSDSSLGEERRLKRWHIHLPADEPSHCIRIVATYRSFLSGAVSCGGITSLPKEMPANPGPQRLNRQSISQAERRQMPNISSRLSLAGLTTPVSRRTKSPGPVRSPGRPNDSAAKPNRGRLCAGPPDSSMSIMQMKGRLMHTCILTASWTGVNTESIVFIKWNSRNKK